MIQLSNKNSILNIYYFIDVVINNGDILFNVDLIEYDKETEENTDLFSQTCNVSEFAGLYEDLKKRRVDC